jgi:hypothetical protein
MIEKYSIWLIYLIYLILNRKNRPSTEEFVQTFSIFLR